MTHPAAYSTSIDLVWQLGFSVAIILTGNIDWRAAKKARLGVSAPVFRGARLTRGSQRSHEEKEGFTLPGGRGFFHSHNRRDFIRRQVEVTRTRERFNGGLGPFPLPRTNGWGGEEEEEREGRIELTLTSFSLIYRESTFIRVLFVRSLNARKFSDPDTHREIAAGGVRDMTWHTWATRVH